MNIPPPHPLLPPTLPLLPPSTPLVTIDSRGAVRPVYRRMYRSLAAHYAAPSECPSTWSILARLVIGHGADANEIDIR